MRRRAFLQTTGAAGLATMLSRPLWALPSDSRYLKTIGLQVYTVRSQLEQNIPATFKAIADAGYYQAELMRVVDADRFLPSAHEAGLKVTSAFIDWRAMTSPEQADVPSFDKILDTAVKHGFRYLVFGYIGKGYRESIDQLKLLADRANQAGEKCGKANIQLCYHNHAFEFEKLPGGKTGFEVFIDEFDSQLVKFELDVFWVAIGGHDPVKAIERLKGRVAQVHLKDLLAGTGTIYDESKVPAEAFKECGNGTIDMPAVLKASEAAGVQQCHVEQDQSPDPIASVGQSLKYLRKL